MTTNPRPLGPNLKRLISCAAGQAQGYLTARIQTETAKLIGNRLDAVAKLLPNLPSAQPPQPVTGARERAEKAAREKLHEELMAVPERKALFNNWAQLNRAMNYVTAEWPYGAANAAEAVREMRSCLWLIKVEVADIDTNFFRDKLLADIIERAYEQKSEHP